MPHPFGITAEDKALAHHLRRIEAYMRGCRLLRFDRRPTRIRNELVHLLRQRAGETVDRWIQGVSGAVSLEELEQENVRAAMYEALLRWIRHIENPADVETYRYLRSHARGGFISRFPASRFLAVQMQICGLFRETIREECRSDPARREELLGLLDQEFHERILHITDFFVEAKVDELRDQELGYRQSVDTAPAPIFRIDLEDGTVLDANRVAEELTGIPRESLIGPKMWELFPPDEQERARQHWLDTCELGHNATDDLHLLCEKGTVVPVFLSSGVIQYGKAQFIQQICVDRSERRRLEAQLIQSEKMAAIGQLAAGVSHEIRNPLAAIQNALYDLREILVDGPEDAREDLSIAEEELLRAKAIIDNLLEFSRVSHVDREAVDLNDLIRKTLLLTNKSMESGDVRVETDLGDIPECMVDQNAMRQVLLNLLTNAVQAMPDGGTLKITTDVIPDSGGNGPRIALEVADSGVGIPSEQMKNIFNPFFTTKAPGQGTGLGLSVVDTIVRQNQGQIQVDSQVGVGTTFRLELPCNCTEDVANATPAVAQPDSR